NSTISGNTVSGNVTTDGAGGGIFNSGTLSVTNSTLSGNASNVSNSGGGIFGQPSHTVLLTNTIVANSPMGGDIAGEAVIGADNLMNDASFSIRDGTNGIFTNHPAGLGTLGGNGGPTQTIPLLAGSLAIDHGAAVGQGPVTDPVPATD